MAIAPDFALLLGLSDHASEDDVKERLRELADFYSSDDVPSSLREWARRQVEQLDRVRHEPPPGADSGRAGTAAADSAPRDTPRRGLFARTTRSPLFLVSIVVVAILAGLAVAQLDPLGTGDGAPAAASGRRAGVVPLDTARLAALTKLAEQSPGEVDVLRDLGDSYSVAGDWQTAVEWYGKILLLDSRDVAALSSIGTAYLNLGRLDEAQAAWAAGLAVSPDDPQLHYDMAYLAFKRVPADLPGARAEWQKVIALAPDSNLGEAAAARLAALPAP